MNFPTFLAATATIGSHRPNEGSEVPEMPNIISLITGYFPDSPWAHFLHQWESIIFSIFIAVVICIVFISISRGRALIPSGIQNGLEFAVESLRNVIVAVLGPQGEKYVPLLGTLFIYVLSMNLMGLIPFLKSPSANINVTAGLAITIFCLVQYLNIKNFGFFGFLYHLAGSPKNALGWAMVPLMFPIELITQISRPVTLAFRLFGNVLGEDTLIAAFALFGVGLMAQLEYPVGLPLQFPFMFLATLTGTMQALVFTLLSTVYILLAMPHEEHDKHSQKHH
jgi:F-type H+-transporting ATPase subunit a